MRELGDEIEWRNARRLYGIRDLTREHQPRFRSFPWEWGWIERTVENFTTFGAGKAPRNRPGTLWTHTETNEYTGLRVIARLGPENSHMRRKVATKNWWIYQWLQLSRPKIQHLMTPARTQSSKSTAIKKQNQTHRTRRECRRKRPEHRGKKHAGWIRESTASCVWGEWNIE